jgi:hypothetical protein
MIRDMRRLHPRGAANRGICVDAEGATLGPDYTLVHRMPNSYWALDRRDAAALQKCVFGDERDADWLFRQCRHIADALNKGELALAQIHGLHLPVGELDGHLLKRIALIKVDFNPDEPRVPQGDPHGGEWTTGSGFTGDATIPDAPILADLIGDVPVAGALDVDQFALQPAPAPSSMSNSMPGAGSSDDGGGDDGEDDNAGFSSDDLVDVAYPGVFHNLVVQEVAEYLRVRGAIVITEVDLAANNGATARADIIASLSPGAPLVIIEVKTGLDPTYTPGQQVIYPMAQIGDHVYSPNAKIEFLGFSPGQWLPPMEFFTFYKQDAKSPLAWFEHPDPTIP